MPKTKKLKVIDGKHYRVRRGELVEIPEAWVGKVTHPQTINKRNSIQRRTRKGP